MNKVTNFDESKLDINNKLSNNEKFRDKLTFDDIPNIFCNHSYNDRKYLDYAEQSKGKSIPE